MVDRAIAWKGEAALLLLQVVDGKGERVRGLVGDRSRDAVLGVVVGDDDRDLRSTVLEDEAAETLEERPQAVMAPEGGTADPDAMTSTETTSEEVITTEEDDSSSTLGG